MDKERVTCFDNCVCQDPWRYNQKDVTHNNDSLNTRLSKVEIRMEKKLPIWVFIAFFTVFSGIVVSSVVTTQKTTHDTLKAIEELKSLVVVSK